jgi:hypothetical protein
MLKAELGDAGVEYIDRVHPVSPAAVECRALAL